MEYLNSTNGLILFLFGIVHITYLFFSGSKSFMRVVDAIFILLGAAIWQYPEKVHAILKVIFHSQG